MKTKLVKIAMIFLLTACQAPWNGTSLQVQISGPSESSRALAGEIAAVTLKASRSGYTDVLLDLTLNPSSGLWEGSLPGLDAGEWLFLGEGKASSGNVLYRGDTIQVLVPGNNTLSLTLVSEAGTFKAVILWTGTTPDHLRYALRRTGQPPLEFPGGPFGLETTVPASSVTAEIGHRTVFSGPWTLWVASFDALGLPLAWAERAIDISPNQMTTVPDITLDQVPPASDLKIYWYYTGEYTPSLWTWGKTINMPYFTDWTTAPYFSSLAGSPGWWVFDLGALGYYPSQLSGIIVKAGNVSGEKLTGPADQLNKGFIGDRWGWNNNGEIQWFRVKPSLSPDSTPPGAMTEFSGSSDNFGRLTLTSRLPGNQDMLQVNLSWTPISPGGQSSLKIYQLVPGDTELRNYPMPDQWFFPGTQYEFTASVTDATGNTGPTVLTYVQPVNLGPPEEILNLTALGGDGKIILSWDKPTAPDLGHYRIAWFETAVGTPSSVIITDLNQLNYTIFGLTNGSQYTVSVQAMDWYGSYNYGTTATATPSPSVVPEAGVYDRLFIANQWQTVVFANETQVILQADIDAGGNYYLGLNDSLQGDGSGDLDCNLTFIDDLGNIIWNVDHQDSSFTTQNFGTLSSGKYWVILRPQGTAGPVTGHVSVMLHP